MIFTLTYDGPLQASGSKSRVKHEIRKQLHPQLKKLWAEPPLSGNRTDIDPDVAHPGGVMLGRVGGHPFASVVHDSRYLRAKLRILILRQEPPGRVLIHGGDIDNRLKTLFDALRRPQSEQEIPTDWTPGDDERPFHCLLDDDRLITRVDVDTARWLAAPDESESRVIIEVQLWTPTPTYWSQSVIG